ncbi:MAG: lipid-A-disaccharide synthase [Acidobacteria bacterium]|nr:lipid-A-disaccharide synthase [Acidobacteriota bacterium]
MVAGEASGDRHAAGLVREAQGLDPRLEFDGIGGDELARAGTRLYHHARDLSVVGIAEVFERAPALWRAMREIKRQLAVRRPAALLLVDFPDFNLHLAGYARRLGIPVVYFVSPQVWAWRRRRIAVIRRRVTHMIVLFPFEAEYYREQGVPVTFAGHPLADVSGRAEPVGVARQRLGLAAGAPVFGLLPGSRPGEVRQHLDPMLATARTVLERQGGAVFLIPVADNLDPSMIEEAAARSGLPVVALQGAFDALVAACDAAVCASGTATLELAVRDVPPVVVYRTARSTYWIGRIAVRVPHISLVNLIAGRGIVPELIQDAFTPRRAAAELLAIGSPGPAREAALAGLAEVRQKLGPPGAYRRAAEALLGVLDGPAPRGGESGR